MMTPASATPPIMARTLFLTRAVLRISLVTHPSAISLFIVLSSIFVLSDMMNKKVNKLTYDSFVSAVTSNKLKEVYITPNENAGVYQITGQMINY